MGTSRWSVKETSAMVFLRYVFVSILSKPMSVLEYKWDSTSIEALCLGLSTTRSPL